MAAFEALLGAKLVGKDGEVNTKDVLGGKKAVGLYFSAHWCPPCRGFTPKLAEMYNSGLKDAGMEIVFISSDRDEAAFGDYFKDQPWLALPFADRDKKASISKKFKIAGIPSFVILDGDGNLSTKNGREMVMKDPKGANLPWKPPTFASVIGDKFVKADGTEVGKEAIDGKTLMIYFSAHWCPPCRSFTPVLAKNYKAYKDAGKEVEVIFSTGDRDEGSFKEYFTEMKGGGGDWLAIPFADSARREALDGLFEVAGIPTLVIVAADGTVINANGRGAVTGDPTGKDFPWKPPSVRNLAQPEGIDETVSLCVLMEPMPPAVQDKIMEEMKKVAEKYIAAAGGDDPKYLLFAGKTSDGPVPQIRTMCGLPAAGSVGMVATKGESSPVGIMRSISGDIASHPVMVILDLDDNGAYYQADDVEITAECMERFLGEYEGKKLERKQLKQG